MSDIVSRASKSVNSVRQLSLKIIYLVESRRVSRCLKFDHSFSWHTLGSRCSISLVCKGFNAARL